MKKKLRKNFTDTRSAIFNSYLAALIVKLLDLYSSDHHSEDFKQTRSQLILTKLRLMCFLFAITVPISAVFDITILGKSFAAQVFPLRIALSASLLVLFFLSRHVIKERIISLLLFCAFLLPTIFYLIIMFQLTSHGKLVPPSFSIMPFLIIIMLGLFPLTLRLGTILFFIISGPIAFANYFYLSQSPTASIQLLWQLSLFGGVAIWLQLGQLSMLMKLYRESTVDPLTGLINRRVLMRQLGFISNQSQLANQPCCLMILDLDKFKRINDTYGHHSGDKVLTALANVLTKHATQKEIAARFGGEEFVFLMPNTQLSHAIDKAESISESIRALRIITDDNQIVTLTTSIGISYSERLTDPDLLLKNADELLYEAKQKGRDCIQFQSLIDD